MSENPYQPPPDDGSRQRSEPVAVLVVLHKAAFIGIAIAFGLLYLALSSMSAMVMMPFAIVAMLIGGDAWWDASWNARDEYFGLLFGEPVGALLDAIDPWGLKP